eukprot:1213123-Prorocentrum_lima.AAC.1
MSSWSSDRQLTGPGNRFHGYTDPSDMKEWIWDEKEKTGCKSPIAIALFRAVEAQEAHMSPACPHHAKSMPDGLEWETDEKIGRILT